MGTLSNKYPNAQAVENALDKGVAAYDNTGQIELVYNGTDIRFNNEVVNFQQIVDYITTDARFCYMVYNNRVLLTSDMQLTGGTRYVFFETSTTDSGLSKNTVVKVYSADGTTISSISHSTIANENFNNKVSTIADNDKDSTIHYPSNKAVTEITDRIKEDLSEFTGKIDAFVETGKYEKAESVAIPSIEQGYIEQNGAFTASNERICLRTKIQTNTPILVKVNGLKARAMLYTKSADNTYNYYWYRDWKSDNFIITESRNDLYVDFNVGKIDNSEITPLENRIEIFTIKSADVVFATKEEVEDIRDYLNNIPVNHIDFEKVTLEDFDIVKGAINGYKVATKTPSYTMNDNFYCIDFATAEIDRIKFKVDLTADRIICPYTENVDAFAYDTSSAIQNQYSIINYDSDTGYAVLTVPKSRERIAVQVSPTDKTVVNLTMIDGSEIEMPISKIFSGANLKEKTIEMSNLSDEVIEAMGKEPKTTISVNKNGTGDFTSIVEALKYVQNDSSHSYDVFVHEGEYVVSDEWTDEELSNANYPNGFYGTVVPSNCSIIGVGSRERTIIYAESNSNYSWNSTWTHISTLNTMGNNTLKNITVKAKGLRYAIHDDFSTSVNATNNYENCVIDCFSGVGQSSLGCGSHDGQTLNIKNCFIAALGWHGHNPATSGATLNISDSTIVSIGLTDYLTGHSMPINIENSNVTALSYSKTVASSPQNMVISIHGCSEFPIIGDAVYDNDNIKRCNTRYGVTKGRAVKKQGIYGVAHMSSSDDASLIYGIALETISSSEYGVTYYSYGRIITGGYISSELIGLSDLAVNDKIGVVNGMVAKITSGNAIGTVEFVTDNNVAYIKLI